ncbi:MAG: ankyrin repeat domain-containing protein [Wolbachia endosymbiont of Fragariocoptes setiger]|nr:ankyrin repeat domain-containing protein [Wolbachia endosymbiont of Fragariocoptes setiger]
MWLFGHRGDSSTPLHWAVKGDNLDLVNHLINLGSNIYAKDRNGKTPIDIAKEEDQMDIVNRLEEVMKGYENGKRAIHFAAEDNDIDALQYRINQGDNVNERAHDGWRPVHSVSESGSFAALKILIDNGAEFYSIKSKTDRDGKAPIHIAAYSRHTDIVKYFVTEKKVSVDWPDGYACGFMWVHVCGNWLTPLHWAAAGGHLDTVVSLIDMGADVHAVDFYNKRPLHYAAESDSLEIVKLLIMAGANPQAVDHNGKTPSDLAKEKGHTNIVSYLESLNRNRRSVESSQRHKRSVEENKKSSIIEELSYLKLGNEKSVMRKAIDNKSTIHNNTLETENFDFNGALLLSTLLSKLPIVGKLFPKIKLSDTNSTTFTSMLLPESMTYAAKITQEFEKILNKTATHLSISKESLNLNPVLLSSEIARLFRNSSNTSELSKVLYSYAKEISGKNNEFLNLVKVELPNLEKTYELKCNNPQINIPILPINNTVPSNITTPSKKEIKYLPSSSMNNINTLAVANNSMTR